MNKGIFERVYETVKLIPLGKVATYGQIAKLIGCPRCARVVGYALHVNPDNKNIPCHRVVNKNGNVAESFAFGGAEIQKQMLLDEGVLFDFDGCINLTKYGWFPN